jgi:hypothetical protein
VKPTEFVRTFRNSGVLALLNWDLIDDRAFSVREIYSDDRAVLGDMFTVWYVTPSGSPGNFSGEFDRPITVREAVDRLDAAPTERRTKINMLQDSFKTYSRPPQLVLPCYDLGHKKALILDGTHRATAAFAGQHDFRIFGYALQGPISSSMLPDLAHFQPC